jgi:hypothetical protein
MDPQNPDGHSVRLGYDRWALVYDHDANPLPALEEPLVRAAFGPAHYVGWPMLVVLDLGA